MSNIFSHSGNKVTGFIA